MKVTVRNEYPDGTRDGKKTDKTDGKEAASRPVSGRLSHAFRVIILQLSPSLLRIQYGQYPNCSCHPSRTVFLL